MGQERKAWTCFVLEYNEQKFVIQSYYEFMAFK